MGVAIAYLSSGPRAALEHWDELTTGTVERVTALRAGSRQTAFRAQALSKVVPPVTLAHAMQLHDYELEAANRAQTTRYWYRTVEERFSAFLRQQAPAPPALAALNLENARAFVLWVKNEYRAENPLTGAVMGRSARSVQDHVRALKGFAAFCVREGLLPANPLAGLKLPRAEIQVIEVFTAEQIRALLQAAANRPNALRDTAIIFFLLATGVRVAELCTLRAGDIDFRERRAKVLGKGSKWRWVSFDAHTAKLLIRYRLERGDDPALPFFVSRSGAPLNRNSVRQMCQRLGRDAGITSVRCSPHTFRHTAACAFLAAHPGALFHLQEMLGHTDLTMTRRYARLVDGHRPLAGPGIVASLGLDQPTKGRR